MKKVKVKVNVQRSDTARVDTARVDTVRIESRIEKKDSIPRTENPKLEVQPLDSRTYTGRMKFGEKNDSIRKKPVIIKIKRK